MHFGQFNLMGYRTPGTQGARDLRQCGRAGESGGGQRLRDRLVRRAPFLQLLRVPLAADDAGAAGRRDQPHQARLRRGGDAALSARAPHLRDRHGRCPDARPARAGRRQRLSALRVRALRRDAGRRGAEAVRVHGDAGAGLHARHLQLQRQALSGARDAHRLAPGEGPARDLGGGRQRGAASARGPQGLDRDADAAACVRAATGRSAQPAGRRLRRPGTGCVRALPSRRCATSASPTTRRKPRASWKTRATRSACRRACASARS